MEGENGLHYLHRVGASVAVLDGNKEFMAFLKITFVFVHCYEHFYSVRCKMNNFMRDLKFLQQLFMQRAGCSKVMNFAVPDLDLLKYIQVP